MGPFEFCISHHKAMSALPGGMFHPEKGGTLITDFIPVGRENAISRKRLCEVTGLTDRNLREHIAQARRNTPIINLQYGDGYFIPDTSDDADMALLRRYVAQEEGRLKSIGWSLKAARNALKGE